MTLRFRSAQRNFASTSGADVFRHPAQLRCRRPSEKAQITGLERMFEASQRYFAPLAAQQLVRICAIEQCRAHLGEVLRPRVRRENQPMR